MNEDLPEDWEHDGEPGVCGEDQLVLTLLLLICAAAGFIAAAWWVSGQ